VETVENSASITCEGRHEGVAVSDPGPEVGGVKSKGVRKDMTLTTEGCCTEDVSTELEAPFCDDTGDKGELSIKPLGVNDVVRKERWVQSEGPSEETTVSPIDLIHL